MCSQKSFWLGLRLKSMTFSNHYICFHSWTKLWIIKSTETQHVTKTIVYFFITSNEHGRNGLMLIVLINELSQHALWSSFIKLSTLVPPFFLSAGISFNQYSFMSLLFLTGSTRPFVPMALYSTRSSNK